MFTLDTALEDEVSIMRRQLLRLVHCAEFSPASEWRDPCRSYVLRDVVCGRCNHCRDLDLCRDPALLRHTWVCRACTSGYDLGAIEQRLVHHVYALEAAFAVQDLRCVRCRQVASKHCRSHCEFCSGELVVSVPVDAHAARIRLFGNIGEYHNFGVLVEVVHQLLGGVVV